MGEPDEPPSSDRQSARDADLVGLSLRWFVRVRWAASVTALGLSVALLTQGRDGALAMTLATVPPLIANALLARRPETARRPSDAFLLGSLLLDGGCLTAWLALAGGPSNPWSALYVVYVALSALLLPARGTAVVVAANALLYRLTFVLAEGEHDHGGDFDAHLEGMYVAYVVSSGLVAYFFARVAAALRARDAELAIARERAARARRVSALTTLAAGAAHELGSPLATIAIVAKELERGLLAAASDVHLVDDARLVREEVDRCRAILDRMAIHAGATIGEAPQRFTPQALRETLQDAHRTRWERVAIDAHGDTVRLPLAVMRSIVENLVANALRATERAGQVRLTLEGRSTGLEVIVEDDGIGMPADVRELAFDPFFTTAPSGQGMGLGLFLVDTMVQALEGSRSLTSEAGRGTRFEVFVPNLPESPS